MSFNSCSTFKKSKRLRKARHPQCPWVSQLVPKTIVFPKITTTVQWISCQLSTRMMLSLMSIHLTMQEVETKVCFRIQRFHSVPLAREEQKTKENFSIERLPYHRGKTLGRPCGSRIRPFRTDWTNSMTFWSIKPQSQLTHHLTSSKSTQ